LVLTVTNRLGMRRRWRSSEVIAAEAEQGLAQEGDHRDP
jgi:hypothetical protein